MEDAATNAVIAFEPVEKEPIVQKAVDGKMNPVVGVWLDNKEE
jgi:hypothetical protein